MEWRRGCWAVCAVGGRECLDGSTRPFDRSIRALTYSAVFEVRIPLVAGHSLKCMQRKLPTRATPSTSGRPVTRTHAQVDRKSNHSHQMVLSAGAKMAAP